MASAPDTAVPESARALARRAHELACRVDPINNWMLAAQGKCSQILGNLNGALSYYSNVLKIMQSARPPIVARLTYRFQPKANLGREPDSLAEHEYIIFGGDDPDMSIGSTLGRMLPLDVQVALRDAEKDLSSWRNSPLRPLIEQLATSLDEDARDEIQKQVNEAQAELSGHAEMVATAQRISERLIAIAREQHAVPLKLGLAPRGSP